MGLPVNPFTKFLPPCSKEDRKLDDFIRDGEEGGTPSDDWLESCGDEVVAVVVEVEAGVDVVVVEEDGKELAVLVEEDVWAKESPLFDEVTVEHMYEGEYTLDIIEEAKNIRCIISNRICNNDRSFTKRTAKS